METFIRNNRKILILFLIAVSLRFINIGMPILEGTATRQTQTAMIARNIYKNGFNFMYPEVDHLGPGTTYLILEFPLLNTLSAFGYKIAGGVFEWMGRFWSILFFAGGFIFLYLLVRKLFDEETAFWSALVYSFSPLSIIYSRTFMPDFEMLFFALGSIYFMHKYSETDRGKDLFLSAIMLMLALLSKVQSFYIMIPLFYLLYSKEGKKIFTKPRNWIALVIGITLPTLWYLRASGIQSAMNPEEAYNFSILHWMRLGEFVSPEFYKDIFKIYSGIFLTSVGLILCVTGLFVKVDKKGRLLYAWIIGAAVFFIVFVSHVDDPYYNLNILPVVSILIARGLIFFKGYGHIQCGRAYGKVVIAALVLITALFIARYGIYYAYIVPRGYKHIPEGAKIVREITKPEDLIIASSAGGPAALYYCDRKGRPFLIPPEDENSTQKAIELFEEYRREGCEYYFCPVMLELNRNKSFKRYLYDNYEVIRFEDGKYVLFRI